MTGRHVRTALRDSDARTRGARPTLAAGSSRRKWTMTTEDAKRTRAALPRALRRRVAAGLRDEEAAFLGADARPRGEAARSRRPEEWDDAAAGWGVGRRREEERA